MHLIEEQHHKKLVTIDTIKRSRHVLDGVKNGQVICVPTMGPEGDTGVQGNSNIICKSACQLVKINVLQCLSWDLVIRCIEILPTWCLIVLICCAKELMGCYIDV
jgi:hypothetical protein